MYSGGKGHQIFQIYGIYYIYSTVKHNIHVASVRPGSQYSTRACVASHCLCIDTHHNVTIDSDPILAFLCVAFLHLIMKLLQNFEYFRVSQDRRNTTQRRHLASHCEPSSRVHSILYESYHRQPLHYHT